MITYLTDVEGRWDKLVSFLDGNPHLALVDGALVLGDGVTFVFGGDALDRGAHARRIVSLLLDAKRRYGDRVILLAGNRDINKLRLVTELGGQPHRRVPAGLSRVELLRWTFANTMGAGKAFDHRQTELAATNHPSTDEAVVDTYLADLAPGGELRAYLAACQLGFRANDTLFVHGGVTAENFLQVPARCENRWITEYAATADVDAWLAALADFYRSEMALFERDTRPDALIAYQSQGPDKLNQQSVVYARPTDDTGNPHLPPRSVIERLRADGIRRVVVGHTPSGDCPTVLRDGDFEFVLADNSYGRLERGSQVSIDELVHVRATTQLDDGAQLPVVFDAAREDAALGLRDRDSGQLVKGRLDRGDYLLFRGLPKYQVEQTVLGAHEIESRALIVPYEP
jgi:hypothetical protein